MNKLEELTPSKEGILLVNKPAGRSSFHLVHKLRQLTGIKKIGHCGTLDPFATGVMVMLIGKSYTTLSDHFLSDDKQYLATFRLGAISDTYDRDGIITPVSDKQPSLQDIEEVIARFQGSISQVPPMFSAKKINGQKLYHLARQGIEIPRAAHPVHLRITLIEYDYPDLTIDVSCSKGTYIRSLAHDMGHLLNTGAYVEKLVRLRSGSFLLEDCIDYAMLNMPGFNYKHHLKKTSELFPSQLISP